MLKRKRERVIEEEDERETESVELGMLMLPDSMKGKVFNHLDSADIELWVHGAPQPLYLHKAALENASEHHVCALTTRLSSRWAPAAIQRIELRITEEEVDQLCGGVWQHIWIYFGLLYGDLYSVTVCVSTGLGWIKKMDVRTVSQDCWMSLLRMADCWLHDKLYANLLYTVDASIQDAQDPTYMKIQAHHLSFLSYLMVKEDFQYEGLCIAIAYSGRIRAACPLDLHYVGVLLHVNGHHTSSTVKCDFDARLLLKLLDCEALLYNKKYTTRDLRLYYYESSLESVRIPSALHSNIVQIKQRDVNLSRYRLHYIWTTVFPDLPDSLAPHLALFGSMLPLCMTSYHTESWIMDSLLFYSTASMDVFLSRSELLDSLIGYLQEKHTTAVWQLKNDDDDPNNRSQPITMLLLQVHPYIAGGHLCIKLYCPTMLQGSGGDDDTHPFAPLEWWLLDSPLCPTRAYYLPSCTTLYSLPSALLSWTTYLMREYRDLPVRFTSDQAWQTRRTALVSKWLQRGFGVAELSPHDYDHLSHYMLVRSDSELDATLLGVCRNNCKEHLSARAGDKEGKDYCFCQRLAWEKEQCWKKFLDSQSPCLYLFHH